MMELFRKTINTIEQIVNYMLNLQFFNKLPAERYAEATRGPGVSEIIKARFHRNDKEMLAHTLRALALEKGFAADNLLAVTHEYVARK